MRGPSPSLLPLLGRFPPSRLQCDSNAPAHHWATHPALNWLQLDWTDAPRSFGPALAPTFPARPAYAHGGRTRGDIGVFRAQRPPNRGVAISCRRLVT